MAPKNAKNAKRSAHDDGDHPVKKAKVDPMVGAILEAVEMTQDMPNSCKAMLAAMVPEAFTVPVSERHSYQSMFVDIVGECIRKTEENMKVSITKDQEHLNILKGNCENLEKHIEDARQIHDAKKLAMDQLKASLAEQFRLVLEKRIALSSAQQAFDAVGAPLAELRKEANTCHQAVSEDLVALRDEGAEVSAAVAIGTKLVALSKHLELEETLAASLPAACAKKTTDRGSFDLMVIEQFEKEVISKAAGFQTAIQAKVESETSFEAALQTAQRELDETTAAHHSAADSLNAALAEKKTASASHDETKAALVDFEPMFQAATASVEEKQSALVNFQTWNVGSFDMLKVKESKPLAPVVTELKPDVSIEEFPQQPTV